MPSTIDKDVSSALRMMENINKYSFEVIFNSLTSAIKALNLGSLYICLYEEQEEDENKIPETSKLLYAFHLGKRLDSTNETFKTRQILPDHLFYTESPRILTIKPMFFGEEHFGYTITDASFSDSYILESIHRHIAALIQTSILFEQQRNIEQKLRNAEKAATQAETIQVKLHIHNEPRTKNTSCWYHRFTQLHQSMQKSTHTG